MDWPRGFRVYCGRSDLAFRDGLLIRAFQPALYFAVFWWTGSRPHCVSLRLPLFSVIHPKDFHRFDDYSRHHAFPYE